MPDPDWNPFKDGGARPIDSPSAGTPGWNPFQDGSARAIAAPAQAQEQSLTPETDKAVSDVDKLFNLPPTKAPDQRDLFTRISDLVGKDYRKAMRATGPAREAAGGMVGAFKHMPAWWDLARGLGESVSADQLRKDFIDKGILMSLAAQQQDRAKRMALVEAASPEFRMGRTMLNTPFNTVQWWNAALPLGLETIGAAASVAPVMGIWGKAATAEEAGAVGAEASAAAARATATDLARPPIQVKPPVQIPPPPIAVEPSIIQGGETDASRIRSTTTVPELEVRPQVGKEAPLRTEGAAPGAGEPVPPGGRPVATEAAPTEAVQPPAERGAGAPLTDPEYLNIRHNRAVTEYGRPFEELTADQQETVTRLATEEFDTARARYVSPYFIEKHGDTYALVDRRKPADVGLISNDLERVKARKVELDYQELEARKTPVTDREQLQPSVPTPATTEAPRPAGGVEGALVAELPPEETRSLYNDAIKAVHKRLKLPKPGDKAALAEMQAAEEAPSDAELEQLYNWEYAKRLAKAGAKEVGKAVTGQVATSPPEPEVAPVIAAAARATGRAISAADLARLKDLQGRWANVNNELLRYVHKPDNPEALNLVEQQQMISGQINALKAKAFPEGHIPDVGVVGGGPVGLGAGLNGELEGLDVSVFEKQPAVGGASRFTSRLENVTGGPTIGERGRDRAWGNYIRALRAGTNFERGLDIAKAQYDPQSQLWTLTTKGGQTRQVRALIAGSGTKFREPTFPGADMVHVGNGEAMIREAKGGPVAVLGGANSAGQAALAAAEYGSPKVYLISRSAIAPEFDPGVKMSNYVYRQIAANPRIQPLVGDEVASIEKAATGTGKVVVTKNGNRIPVKSVSSFMGGTPRTEWLPDYVLRDDKGLVRTNENLQALMLDKQGNVVPVPGLFVGGDIRSGAIGRVLSAEADGQRAVTAAHKYIDGLRQQGMLPEWKGRSLDRNREAATVSTTPPATTVSPLTRQLSLPAGTPSGRGVMPPSGEPSPVTTQFRQFPTKAASTEALRPPLVEPPPPPWVPPRPPTLSEAQTTATIDDVFRHLHETGTTSAPSPALGLTKNEMIQGGRMAMQKGVDPMVVAQMQHIRPDLRYAVLRAHAEDLRDNAVRLDNIAQKTPTQANQAVAERAFQDYSRWDTGVVQHDKMAAGSWLKGNLVEDLEPEGDLRSMTDLRQQFVRENGRDMKPKELKVARAQAKELADTSAKRIAAMDDYSAQLRKLAPEPEYRMDNEQQFYNGLANMLKKKFPCE